MRPILFYFGLVKVRSVKCDVLDVFILHIIVIFRENVSEDTQGLFISLEGDGMILCLELLVSRIL